jgi:hypothetical protein
VLVELELVTDNAYLSPGQKATLRSTMHRTYGGNEHVVFLRNGRAGKFCGFDPEDDFTTQGAWFMSSNSTFLKYEHKIINYCFVFGSDRRIETRTFVAMVLPVPGQTHTGVLMGVPRCFLVGMELMWSSHQ